MDPGSVAIIWPFLATPGLLSAQSPLKRLEPLAPSPLFQGQTSLGKIQTMSNVAYTIKPLPPSRRFLVDGMEFGGRKHCIHGLIEFDIKQSANVFVNQGNKRTSPFTRFLDCGCARLVHQNKLVHATRDWRSRELHAAVQEID